MFFRAMNLEIFAGCGGDYCNVLLILRYYNGVVANFSTLIGGICSHIVPFDKQQLFYGTLLCGGWRKKYVRHYPYQDSRCAKN
jgi:hypothetical protein